MDDREITRKYVCIKSGLGKSIGVGRNRRHNISVNERAPRDTARQILENAARYPAARAARDVVFIMYENVTYYKVVYINELLHK